MNFNTKIYFYQIKNIYIYVYTQYSFQYSFQAEIINILFLQFEQHCLIRYLIILL